MDTSKYYVKMCRKADEVQAFWQPKNGDYFYGLPQDFAGFEQCVKVHQYFECEDEYYAVIPLGYDVSKQEFSDETEVVRLPSQADLQQMLDYEFPYDMVKSFAIWVKSLSVSEQERHKTMAQLWLGFVMLRNYHKTWNGRDWEKIDFQQDNCSKKMQSDFL